MSEHDDQKAVFDWAKAAVGIYPALANLFAVPNGVRTNFRQISKLKAEGFKTGVPDMILLAPRSGFHGLTIEQKRKPNKQEPDQIEWQRRLTAEGYAYWLSWSAKETIEVIEGYLAGRMT